MTLEAKSSSQHPLLSLDDQAAREFSTARAHDRSLNATSANPPATLKSPSSSLPSANSALPAAAIPRTQQQFAHKRKAEPSGDTVRLATQLVERQNGFEIGRYGLTAATVVRDQSFVGAGSQVSSPTSSSSSSDPAYLAKPPIPRPAHTWKPPENGGFVRPTLDQRPEKRPAGQGDIDSASRPPIKKHRRLPPPGKIDLGHIHPPRNPAELRVTDGVSPLFFSSSARHMTGRPPSFSTTEPTVAMLNRLRDEQSIVKTVKLAKGTASTASPARGHSMSTPTSAGSETLSSKSGDQRHVPAELRDLQGWSVLDLLEADERPTFIVDLANAANQETGLLKIVYKNASLRAAQELHELISQNADVSLDFSKFKSWVVSFVKDNRARSVSLPSFSYGGICWTCSTLGGRFRFISGSNSAVSITPTTPAPPARAGSALDDQQSHRNAPPGDFMPPSRDRALSESDYFGDADPNQNALLGRRAHSEPRTTDDMRPDTPVIPTREEIDEDIESDLTSTFDWTRIVDTSGNWPLCPVEFPLLSHSFLLDCPRLPGQSLLSSKPNPRNGVPFTNLLLMLMMLLGMPPHLQFARSINWEATPLGSIDEWPGDLRTMSNMVMGSPHPAAMYWGPEYTAIYNDAYIDLAGNKHPKLMGQSYTEAWAEIWDEIKPVFDAAWHSGQAMMKHDDRLFISRNGFLEETFFNWSIVPMVGSDGSVVALYNPAFENTRRKVNERRMLTLREVGERTSLARDVKQFWKQVHKGLEYNQYDIPFALIYSIQEDSESDTTSMHSGSVVNPPSIYLEGTLGVPAGHHCAIPSIDLKTSDEGFAAYMRMSMSQPSVPIVLSKDNGTLPQSLIDGIQWRGFGDPSRTVVVFPIYPTTGDSVVGFIVLGVNPRRPYNDDYRLFISLLSRQLATSMASVVLFEEEIKRGQQAARIAALDRQQLSQQLRLRTQEAVESEYKFTRMAEFAPVGIFIANAQGHINFCNDSWWEISRHPRTVNSIKTWMDSIIPEDRLVVKAAWRKLLDEKLSITQEFRFKAAREAEGHPIETWALMSAYPEKDASGSVKAIFGCITDISQQKWAEAFQKQRREEAMELKRQQENFIDMTSHEMRNPLSALCQCADEIIGSILTYRRTDPELAERLNAMLDTCLEAANTISLCANHQKRIVDDVLTLSRLDSRMIEVTPTVARPLEVIQTSLKMFDAELASNNIKAELKIDSSYFQMGINYARLDPARLQQVLINLLTNAIKFTHKQEQRSIVVTLGASKDVSQAQVAGIEFFEGESEVKEDITDRMDWGDGEKFNLHISVADTGTGLTDEERAMLFQRFRQTSPRTHVEYGGSGLGLFISRMLTELQGGQIGVLSEKGVGSTFAFYIRSRKCAEPQPASPSVQKDGMDFVTMATAVHPVIDPTTVDVLVVEDNEVNQKVLGRLLKRFGFRAHLANHGGEAIEKLQRSRHWDHQIAAVEGYDPVVWGENEEMINVSIILMDLEMPIMDGTTCARKIRELEKLGILTTRLPIIAVTAYVRPEQIGDAKASGMDDIVSKPFRAHELTPKITSLLVNPPSGDTPHSPMSLASPGSEIIIPGTL